MTQPTPYAIATNFAADEAAAMGGRSTVRTAKVDAEFAALQTTIGQVLTNLAILQRDDTGLANGIVTTTSLSAAVNAILATVGATVRGDWVTATAYALKDLVNQAGATYMCATAHTSGVFATDLAAGKWLIISPAASSFSAASVSNTPAGSIAATDVQSALNELDTEKLAKASNLSDVATPATALSNLGGLAKAGGTMTGDIVLAGAPTAALHPATKTYADDIPDGMLAGQCTFAVTSTTQAKLSPWNGNRLFIAGTWYTIPSTGVTVSNASTATSTTYYVYCYQNSGTLTLELSTTGYTTDATYGNVTKSGDSSRVLVGMVRTQSGSAIFETASTLYLSWFNKRPRARGTTFTADRTTASAAAVEVNTEIRNAFLCWSGDAVRLAASGAALNSGGFAQFGIGVDGTTVRVNGSGTQATTYTGVTAQEETDALSEGYHYATILGSASAGTSTYRGVAGSMHSCRLTVEVQG